MMKSRHFKVIDRHYVPEIYIYTYIIYNIINYIDYIIITIILYMINYINI